MDEQERNDERDKTALEAGLGFEDETNTHLIDGLVELKAICKNDEKNVKKLIVSVAVIIAAAALAVLSSGII